MLNLLFFLGQNQKSPETKNLYMQYLFFLPI